MRVHVVDPSAYTPPYDHALCSALAAEGVEVTLYTSRFAHGTVPDPHGYERRESFYRIASRARAPGLRRAIKLAEHAPDMLAYRREARSAELVHFQWLALQQLDGLLLPKGRPLVLTAHDILPREPRPGQLAAQRRLYDRFDAIVVHSEHGRARLTGELALDPARVHVIPHGVLRPAEDVPGEELQGEGWLPAELRGSERPVVLFFGLLRPYKGIDVLLDAWRQRDLGGSGGAELWIVGMPRMDIGALRSSAPAGVRFVPRFVSGREIPAVMQRASLVVLPYREIDQSGVAFTALGLGVPLLLSDVGGFPEIAATGAARTVPAGEPAALGQALEELLGDPAALATMARRARAAAEGQYAWEAIALKTLELYGRLLDG
jgi:glycosyltransferase involved in cell wall biosynthesis